MRCAHVRFAHAGYARSACFARSAGYARSASRSVTSLGLTAPCGAPWNFVPTRPVNKDGSRGELWEKISITLLISLGYPYTSGQTLTPRGGGTPGLFKDFKSQTGSHYAIYCVIKAETEKSPKTEFLGIFRFFGDGGWGTPGGSGPGGFRGVRE